MPNLLYIIGITGGASDEDNFCPQFFFAKDALFY